MRTSIFLFLFLVCSLGIQAGPFPDPPSLPRLVNDYAGILSATENNNLENQLVSFARETSTQISVVLINDLSGYDISDYAPQLAEAWGIGQQGKNNGILILIKPKTPTEKGQAFIATGYGLEGAVPDAVARRIVQNEMIPHFADNDYYGGILAGIKILSDLTRGEYTADKYLEQTQSQGHWGLFFLIFLFVIFMLIIGSAGKKRNSSLGHDLPFWAFLTMLGSGSQRHSGSWGGFSGGSGGFGGFGGGKFGGGGAGGSW